MGAGGFVHVGVGGVPAEGDVEHVAALLAAVLHHVLLRRGGQRPRLGRGSRAAGSGQQANIALLY